MSTGLFGNAEFTGKKSTNITWIDCGFIWLNLAGGFCFIVESIGSGVVGAECTETADIGWARLFCVKGEIGINIFPSDEIIGADWLFNDIGVVSVLVLAGAIWIGNLSGIETAIINVSDNKFTIKMIKIYKILIGMVFFRCPKMVGEIGTRTYDFLQVIYVDLSFENPIIHHDPKYQKNRKCLIRLNFKRVLVYMQKLSFLFR